MNSLQSQIKNYLEFCEYQKRLDRKTIKAYRIDLQQFSSYFETAGVHDCTEINYEQLEKHIASMHEKYRPKTVKRKIASEKSFFHYLEYRKIIPVNPFTRMHVHFRESIILPRTIPLHSIENFLRAVYSRINSADTEYKRKRALRDAAVTELLFATGMRISELCSLKNNDADLKAGTVMIYGKGRKERLIHIGNECVINILKEYMRKGFALDDERLKNLGGGGYFKELLERIRDIRASEKVFYRQVLEIYATSIDYGPKAEISILFFKKVQNKIHYAIHGQTAAEVIYTRADAEKEFMGLTTFVGNQPTLKEAVIAKNYLSEKELRAMGQLVSGYLDFAERQAEREQTMTMKDWAKHLDCILTMSGEQLLQGNGNISHKQAVDKATDEYKKYKARTISDVEEDYLNSIKLLEQKTDKK